MVYPSDFGPRRVPRSLSLDLHCFVGIGSHLGSRNLGDFLQHSINIDANRAGMREHRFCVKQDLEAIGVVQKLGFVEM